MDEGSVLLLAMAFNVIFIIALFAIYASRVKRVGPNTAVIISGRGQGRPARITDEGVPFRVVVGGRSFVWPIVETHEYLSLEPVQAAFKFDRLVTSDGKRVSLTGKAQYKIPAEKAAVIKAAQHFLSKSDEAKQALVMGMIEDNLRRIVEESGKEEIEQSPMKFGDKVIEAGRPKMGEMGVEVMSLVITVV